MMVGAPAVPQRLRMISPRPGGEVNHAPTTAAPPESEDRTLAPRHSDSARLAATENSMVHLQIIPSGAPMSRWIGHAPAERLALRQAWLAAKRPHPAAKRRHDPR